MNEFTEFTTELTELPIIVENFEEIKCCAGQRRISGTNGIHTIINPDGTIYKLEK